MSKKTNPEDMKEIIKRWKELNVEVVNMDFDCGGDSMNETSFTIHTQTGVITDTVITDFFEDQVYRNVQFYEVSDGHYQGEFGTVEITLDEDNEESTFTYIKQSRSEWNEMCENTGQVSLTQEEADFIKEHIRSIEGGADERRAIVYAKDFIISEEREEMLNQIVNKIDNTAKNLVMEGLDFEGDEVEENEWYRFSYVNIDKTNTMHITVEKSFRVFKDDY